MAKSWSNPLVTAYEVKVARSDFLRDDKWQAYLQYCNEFYFVCPHGVILPEELPAEAGLLMVSATGTKLFVKKRAQRRGGEIPESVFRYILMCRARVERGSTFHPGEPDNRERWRQWLSQGLEDRELGYRVSEGIRKTVEHQVDQVRRENERLKLQISAFEDVRKVLADLGLQTDNPHGIRWRVAEQARRARDVIPSELVDRLNDLIESAGRMKAAIGKLTKGEDSEVSAA